MAADIGIVVSDEDDGSVSPYLKRRLRSYREALRDLLRKRRDGGEGRGDAPVDDRRSESDGPPEEDGA